MKALEDWRTPKPSEFLALQLMGWAGMRSPALRKYGFHDAHRGFCGHHPGKAQAAAAEQRRVFGLRSLSAAGSHQHDQVEQLAGVWLAVGRQHHLDDE